MSDKEESKGIVDRREVIKGAAATGLIAGTSAPPPYPPSFTNRSDGM